MHEVVAMIQSDVATFEWLQQLAQSDAKLALNLVDQALRLQVTSEQATSDPIYCRYLEGLSEEYAYVEGLGGTSRFVQNCWHYVHLADL